MSAIRVADRNKEAGKIPGTAVNAGADQIKEIIGGAVSKKSVELVKDIEDKFRGLLSRLDPVGIESLLVKE